MEDGRRQQGAGEGTQRGTPWGFFLVLAAIVMVAIMYSATIYALGRADGLTPETVFGAMAASFTVIGTLVGTYFGIKAGLDGQDKLREGVGRAAGAREDRGRDRERDRDEHNAGRNGGQRGERRPAEDEAEGSREPRVRRRADQGDRQEWEGVGV